MEEGNKSKVGGIYHDVGQRESQPANENTFRVHEYIHQGEIRSRNSENEGKGRGVLSTDSHIVSR